MPQAEPGEEALGAWCPARARGWGRGEMKGTLHPNTSSAAYRRPEVFLRRVITVEGLLKFLEMTRDWMALEDNEEEARGRGFSCATWPLSRHARHYQVYSSQRS